KYPSTAWGLAENRSFTPLAQKSLPVCERGARRVSIAGAVWTCDSSLATRLSVPEGLGAIGAAIESDVAWGAGRLLPLRASATTGSAKPAPPPGPEVWTLPKFRVRKVSPRGRLT